MASKVSLNGQFNWAVSCLENEQIILNKLIYRNRNQHGKTQIFSYLKGVNNNLKVFTVARIRKLSDFAETSIRMAALNKISQLDFNEIVGNVELIYEALKLTVTTSNWCITTYRNLVLLLSRKVFVPLYSLLLALVARIAKCLLIITLHFDVRFQALIDQMKHIGVVQSKLSDRVLATISANTLPVSYITAITALRETVDKNETDINRPKNVPNSVASSSSVAAPPPDSEDVGDVVGNQRPISNSVSNRKVISSNSTATLSVLGNTTINDVGDDGDDPLPGLRYEDEEQSSALSKRRKGGVAAVSHLDSKATSDCVGETMLFDSAALFAMDSSSNITPATTPKDRSGKKGAKRKGSSSSSSSSSLFATQETKRGAAPSDDIDDIFGDFA